jgi:hypothetical protein
LRPYIRSPANYASFHPKSLHKTNRVDVVAEVVVLYLTGPEPVREWFVKRAEQVRGRYGSSGQRKISGHARLDVACHK